jgi:hypothetical protein
MSAILYFEEWNGEQGEEVATSKQMEAVQFKSEDSPAVEDYATATAPLTKPNAGVNRSVEKYLRVYLESLEGATAISNLEVFHAGGGSPSGVAVFSKVEEDYATPLSGGRSPGGAMIGGKTNLSSHTSDNPLVLGVGPFDTVLATVGDFLVLQLEVYPSATITATPTRSLFLRWDES